MSTLALTIQEYKKKMPAFTPILNIKDVVTTPVVYLAAEKKQSN